MDKQELEIRRHSMAHLMVMAVLDMFPEAKMGVGPAVEDGFYQDFDLPRTLIPEDLEIIKEKMQKFADENAPFEKSEVDVDEAIMLFKKTGQDYKAEMAEDLKKEGNKKVNIYRSGHWVDLCSGPHVDSTGELDLKSIQLDRISGAYWKSDEKNKMLQRIYGVQFENAKALRVYLKKREEAAKRDHRLTGKDLFHIDEEVGAGLPLWKPDGALLWRVIENFWYDKHLENGYELVRSPHIGSKSLWEKSGHWNFFDKEMYPPIEIGKNLEEAGEEKDKIKMKEPFLLKPMNCPFHVQIYNSESHSYRDLPMRTAECGTVYRYEKSGEISGLTRVRGFTQDDAHVICTKDQVEEELKRVAIFIKEYFEAFGFNDYKVYLSLRDPKDKEKYAGNDEGWDFTEKVLEKVAKDLGVEYEVEQGEAAFYGPKLDYKIKDVLGREWQCSTLQFDFNLPERFNMSYINKEGKKERPYMLHRALMGSFERFIGLLIEHYERAFPLWLSPVQVKVVPVSEKFLDYAREVEEALRKQKVRVKLDSSDESLSKKIRNGEKQRVPYILVVGEKEKSSKTVNVRKRGEKKQSEMDLGKFADQVVKESETKA